MYRDKVRCAAGCDIHIVFDENKVYEITSHEPSDLSPMRIPDKFRYIADFLSNHTKQPMLIEAMADLDLSWATPFQMDVYKALAAIPAGTVLSYAALAELSGHKGASRAVGSTMAKNRFLIVLPCHRVITSSGKLGGFSGGLDLKVKLLKCEGRDEF